MAAGMKTTQCVVLRGLKDNAAVSAYINGKSIVAKPVWAHINGGPIVGKPVWAHINGILLWGSPSGHIQRRF